MNDYTDLFNTIDIHLYRSGTADTAMLTTRSTESLPSSFDDLSRIKIVDSNRDVIFDGEFLFPIKKPLSNPKANIFTIKADGKFSRAKSIKVRQKAYNAETASNIVIDLVETYLPEVKTSGVKSNDTELTIDFDGWSLFDALNFVAEVCGWMLKIGFGREGSETVTFKPWDDYAYQAGVVIDDEHFISATPFYYDASNLYNKVTVIGKPQRHERLYFQHAYSETGEITIPEEEYEPYDISIENSSGKILYGGEAHAGETLEFGEFDYLYCPEYKTIYFKDPLQEGESVSIHYWVDIPPTVTKEDTASISQYGLREAEDLVYDWIDDITTLTAIADKFIETHKDPVLVGSVKIRREQIDTMVYPGDKIWCDLSRYYTGYFEIGRVDHHITPTKHEITLHLDRLDAWAIFAKMLQRLRELQRAQKKPPPRRKQKENTDNAICWRTEIIEITPSTESATYDLKTIFIERPFLYVGVRMASEDDEGNPIPSVPEWTEIGPVFRLVKEKMTRDEFKNATNTEWNINWEDERDIWQKVEGYCMVDDFIYIDDEGNEHDYSDYIKVMLKITGYGALKNA